MPELVGVINLTHAQSTYHGLFPLAHFLSPIAHPHVLCRCGHPVNRASTNTGYIQWLVSNSSKLDHQCEIGPLASLTFVGLIMWSLSSICGHVGLVITHPQLLVWVASERFLLAWATFRAGLASESHWLQPMLVLTVVWWLALVSVGGL